MIYKTFFCTRQLYIAQVMVNVIIFTGELFPFYGGKAGRRIVQYFNQGNSKCIFYRRLHMKLRMQELQGYTCYK